MSRRTPFAVALVGLSLVTVPRLARADQPAPNSTSSQASPATVPQPTPPPAAVPAPTPEELARRRVVVDIDSTRPSAVVERRVSVREGPGFLMFDKNDQVWEQVCVTPCRVDLDRYSTYRVAEQNKIAGSHAFTLPQERDALRLKIDAGDNRMHHVGTVLTTLGTAAAIVGVALVAGARLFTDESGAREAGFITAGSGVVLLGAGIPLSLLTSTSLWNENNRL